MSESVSSPQRRAVDGPPSVRIVEALAGARGDDSTEIEPLYGQVDLEAIDDLVENSRGDVRVEITVDEQRVEVLGDGTVGLR